MCLDPQPEQDPEADVADLHQSLRWGSSFVSAFPPERWQRGTKYGVLLHLEWIYDYTNASSEPYGGAQAIPEPEKRELPWERGVVDGAPAAPAAFPPFNVPPPVWTVR